MGGCLAAACAVALLLLLSGSPAAGEWVPAESEQTCRDKLLCVGSNLTWATPHEYGAEDGCAAFASKGIKAVEFYGDSFMRHLYEGLVLTLTGNYKDGALLPGTRNCDYNLQFEEKRCRLELRLKMEACGGALKVSYEWGAPPLESVCGEKARGRLVLYSVGNHPIEGVSLSEDPGRGRNSLPHYTAMMQRDEVCTYAVEHPNACRLWWVTTHQRLNSIHHIGYPLESQRHIRKFNEGMRSWFEAGHCGPAHVVDVFNMTEALVMELPTEAAPLTHDGFHWSEVINLLKAQVLLNNIADVLPAAADQPAAPLQYGVPLPYRRSLSGS